MPVSANCSSKKNAVEGRHIACVLGCHGMRCVLNLHRQPEDIIQSPHMLGMGSLSTSLPSGNGFGMNPGKVGEVFLAHAP